MDNDLAVLQEAFSIVSQIDAEYRRANFNDKVKLKTKRDEAFSAFSQARLKLLEDGVICSDADLAQMKELRKTMEANASLANVMNTAGKFMGILLKFI